MIRNYLKIAWRNLVRQRSFTLINITGLALGLTCSLVIWLWVEDEKKIDRFHANEKNLFQVYERHFYDGKVQAGYPTQGLLADELKRKIPAVHMASGLEYASAPGTQSAFQSEDKVSKWSGMFAGDDFLSMFSYPIVEGNARALQKPLSLAISTQMAEQFFGSPANALGKTLRFQDQEDLRVTAVFEKPGNNSSIQFDFLRSWVDFLKQNAWVNNWGNTSPSTFVLLHAGADPGKVNQDIRDFIYRYQQKDKSFYSELALQPYGDRYLHSNFSNGYPDGGRIEYVRLFTIVALVVLLIACINFMNLATARSARRAKEVGVRKVIGAGRLTLIGQFAGEALLLTFLAVIFAIGAATYVLPLFNELTGKSLRLPFHSPGFWATIIALLFSTGLIAGSYPAFFLSSLNPVSVLKSGLKFSWKSVFIRRGLVVFQFSLSIILIVGMIVIYRQLDYVQSRHLGYDKENLIYIPIEGELVQKYDRFKKDLLLDQAIVSISKMRNSPTVIEHHTGSIGWPGKDPNLTISFADAVVGYDFVSTMKLQVKEGRDFSESFGRDSAGYMLNETAVARMGLADPVGKTVTWGNRPGIVIGVLKDFHFNSMHQAIEPLIIRLDEKWSWGTILVRTRPGQIRQAIAKLEQVCRSVNPAFPFTYQFSDQQYAHLYKSEQVVSKISNLFAVLAILISCLGLFGLAAFAAEQRVKELGVRKVLGASVASIIGLLARSFLKPVCVSMLIAFPIAGWWMNKWLQGFAYQAKLEWWMFASAGLATIVIALLTVSYQSIRAAIASPLRSLRSE
jgi:putative ABC transport system permease protein